MHHLARVRVAFITKSMNNRIERGEKGALQHCWWEGKLVTDTMENNISSAQFSSVAQLCPTLCDPMDCSTPGLPVHHQLLESTQTHVHWVGDAIQPSRPLSSPSPPAFNLSQHQSHFKWVNSSHQVAKILELQLQHQSFQWTPRPEYKGSLIK